MIKLLSYKESRKYMSDKGLKSNKDCRIYKSKNSFPDFLPINPDIFYKEDWLNWMDFLSFDRNRKHKKFMCFDKAREISRKLNIQS